MVRDTAACWILDGQCRGPTGPLVSGNSVVVLTYVHDRVVFGSEGKGDLPAAIGAVREHC